MATVSLDINDATQRLTLKAVLERDGHTIVSTGEVLVTDAYERALNECASCPTLVLATANQIRDAIEIMRQGVFGYIFVPFQPGEASLMVERAARTPAGGGGAGPSPATELVSLEQVESRHIQDVLRACRNNQAKAARVLGIGRNTLWRKLKRIKGSE